jgi:hypothetical protein
VALVHPRRADRRAQPRRGGAYKYRLGVANRLFSHRGGYDVADTDQNAQPYLQDFKRLGLQWVTTLKPRGKTNSTGMVMTTDAITGTTRTWKVPDTETLIGNAKALDIVKGERLGVNFAGAFRAIEPRQVFPGGRLQFLISVVPAAAQRVTLNVIVDAQRQEVVKVFPSGAAGDRDLITYLTTGHSAGYDFNAGAGGDTGGGDSDLPTTTTPATGPLPSGTGATATLTRLLEENHRDQRATDAHLSDLEAQEADLRRLLARRRKRDGGG